MATALKSVVVVGGGAAGLAAAWRAASLGHSVTLLEANGRLGVKLRISGGGKCNVTHEGTPKALLAAFPTDQARFLRPAFHGFTSEDLRELLRQRGVETYVRENGRVFPLDRPGSAAAVVAAWEGLVREAGVVVRSQARAMDLVGDAPRVEAVVLESGQWVRGEQFILAVGGASYPETGTRGEWLGRLEKRGVEVRPWRPALAPIPLERPRPQWSGVALREGAMHLWEGRGGRRLGRFPGDLLFTSAGLSGPAALEGSEATETARRQGAAWLTYAFTELDEASLDGELQQFQGAHPHTAARTWVQRWMPERVAATMVEEASLAADQRMRDLSRQARRALVMAVSAFPLGAPKAVPLARGEVAAGGVALPAVDPHSLRVKGWQNLRVCGELLDIHGPIGGYNLQAAFSTGFLAGSLAE